MSTFFKSLFVLKVPLLSSPGRFWLILTHIWVWFPCENSRWFLVWTKCKVNSQLKCSQAITCKCWKLVALWKVIPFDIKPTLTENCSLWNTSYHSQKLCLLISSVVLHCPDHVQNKDAKKRLRECKSIIGLV